MPLKPSIIGCNRIFMLYFSRYEPPDLIHLFVDCPKYTHDKVLYDPWKVSHNIARLISERAVLGDQTRVCQVMSRSMRQIVAVCSCYKWPGVVKGGQRGHVALLMQQFGSCSITLSFMPLADYGKCAAQHTFVLHGPPRCTFLNWVQKNLR